jgi:proline iminopeptidase
MLRWGATEDELRQPSPASDLIAGSKRGSTMAITVDAPPSEVWPWLVQMGCDRAGWYSWDRLDNAGRPSARQIHPEWQAISVGQRIWSTPDREHWFEVEALEPERFLALRASFTRAGRQLDSAGPRPASFSDTLWAFQLVPLPGDRTRLIVTVYVAATAPKVLSAVMNILFWEPTHWVMQTRQLANLKQRAEEAFAEHRRASARQPSGPTHGASDSQSP